jgi:hypothetical protein
MRKRKDWQPTRRRSGSYLARIGTRSTDTGRREKEMAAN